MICNFTTIFFCYVSEEEFVGKYQKILNLCILDLLMRDCWILKKVLCKYYFAIPNSRINPKFKTVKEFLSNMRSSYIFSSDSESEPESDEENFLENSKLRDTFEEEYNSYISLEKNTNNAFQSSAKGSSSSDHSEGKDMEVHEASPESQSSDDTVPIFAEKVKYIRLCS